MNTQHIRSAYDRDLEAIQAQILKMGGLVEEAILRGGDALAARDVEAAQAVRQGDRAIATEPEVLLMDEPCSALDPIATAQVEELIDELRRSYSVVIVTHSMQQAARVSQKTAFFHLGHLVEMGETGQIFQNPRDPRTESYISGRIG